VSITPCQRRIWSNNHRDRQPVGNCGLDCTIEAQAAAVHTTGVAVGRRLFRVELSTALSRLCGLCKHDPRVAPLPPLPAAFKTRCRGPPAARFGSPHPRRHPPELRRQRCLPIFPRRGRWRFQLPQRASSSSAAIAAAAAASRDADDTGARGEGGSSKGAPRERQWKWRPPPAPGHHRRSAARAWPGKMNCADDWAQTPQSLSDLSDYTAARAFRPTVQPGPAGGPGQSLSTQQRHALNGIPCHDCRRWLCAMTVLQR
jgi:hypothetical protein